MTNRQRLELEQSEKREKINGLLGKEKMTDEERGELVELTKRMQELEPELRAAIVVEDNAETRARLEHGEDAEARELKEIRSRVKVGQYVASAIANRSVGGAEGEFNQALKFDGNKFPLQLLAPPEERALTDADTTTMPRRWLDRVFTDTAAMYIGITMESVPTGAASFPVTATGASPTQRGRTQAAGADAWTVSVLELKPTRNSARLVYSIEDSARIPELESALVRDLRMAMTDAVDDAVFLGDDSANENAGDITGLQTATGVTESTITQALKVAAKGTLDAFTDMVDGLYAYELEDLNCVMSVGAWRLWKDEIFTAAADSTTIGEFLKRAGLTYRARNGFGNTTAADSFGAYLGKKRGINGAGVAAIWDAGELIVDRYSSSAQGEVNLTLHYLWAFGLPRAANFGRVKFVA